MVAPADQILIVLVSALRRLRRQVGTGLVDGQEMRRRRNAEALWSLHDQQFHLPLLDAGRQLEARLSELADIYRGKPSPAHARVVVR